MTAEQVLKLDKSTYCIVIYLISSSMKQIKSRKQIKSILCQFYYFTVATSDPIKNNRSSNWHVIHMKSQCLTLK